MSRGPLAEDEHSRKGNVGGTSLRPAAPPHFLFCRGHPLPFPLHFCLHFIRRSMGNLYNFLMLMLMKMLMLMLCFLLLVHLLFFHAWQMLMFFVMLLCFLCIVVFFSVLVMSGKFGNCCVILDYFWATHESVASFIPATVLCTCINVI